MFKNYSLFIVLALLWSFSFLGIKICVTDLPPVFSALLRVGTSFLVITLFFIAKNKGNASRIFFLPFSKASQLWLAGFFTQALPFAFLFYGEKFIAPALASIINSTVSIWALILGGIFFRDFSQWTVSKLLGLLLGLAGMVTIFLPLLKGGQTEHLTGVLSVTMMAICYAIGGLLTQHLVFAKTKTSLESNLWHQHFSSLLLLILISSLLEPWPALKSLIHPKIIFAILYLGVFGTAIAWMIYFYLIKHWGTVRATSVMYIVPVLAIVWDSLFLHLSPTWNEVTGAIAILCGVILIQYQRKKI